MADTCFVCLDGGDLRYACEPNTCHNLKAHEHCLREHARVNPICTICKVKYEISPIENQVGVGVEVGVEVGVVQNRVGVTRCKIICRIALLTLSVIISGMVSTATFYAVMLTKRSEIYGLVICLFLTSIFITLMNCLALSGAWNQLSQSSE